MCPTLATSAFLLTLSWSTEKKVCTPVHVCCIAAPSQSCLYSHLLAQLLLLLSSAPLLLFAAGALLPAACPGISAFTPDGFAAFARSAPSSLTSWNRALQVAEWTFQSMLGILSVFPFFLWRSSVMQTPFVAGFPLVGFGFQARLTQDSSQRAQSRLGGIKRRGRSSHRTECAQVLRNAVNPSVTTQSDRAFSFSASMRWHSPV